MLPFEHLKYVQNKNKKKKKKKKTVTSKTDISECPLISRNLVWIHVSFSSNYEYLKVNLLGIDYRYQ